MFSLQTMFGHKDDILDLLQASSEVALDAVGTLDELLRDQETAPSMAGFAAARHREKELASRISESLINTFVTSLDREDVEAINGSLYRIPKTVEKFADRYVLVRDQLEGIDFSKRIGILHASMDIVVKMVAELHNGLRIKTIRKWQDRLQALEAEADRLLLEPYQDLYLHARDPMRVILAKDLFETLEQAIDGCRDVGNVVYSIVLKNS